MLRSRTSRRPDCAHRCQAGCWTRDYAGRSRWPAALAAAARWSVPAGAAVSVATMRSDPLDCTGGSPKAIEGSVMKWLVFFLAAFELTALGGAVAAEQLPRLRRPVSIAESADGRWLFVA